MDLADFIRPRQSRNRVMSNFIFEHDSNGIQISIETLYRALARTGAGVGMRRKPSEAGNI